MITTRISEFIQDELGVKMMGEMHISARVNDRDMLLLDMFNYQIEIDFESGYVDISPKDGCSLGLFELAQINKIVNNLDDIKYIWENDEE